MKQILAILFCLCAFSSFSQDNALVNDKNAQVRNVGSFDQIKVSGAIDLYLSQSDADAVAVSATDIKYRDNIKTEVSNGVLIISYSSNGMSWLSGNKHLVAYVSFKMIKGLEITGASTCKVTGTINVPELKLKLSGASTIKGVLNISNLTIVGSGASDAKLSGSASKIDINLSGASNLKSYDLLTDQCVVTASGASDIRISVKNELSAHASGASSLYYKGNPTVKESRSSGASTIQKKD
jgi:hypothetical protein